MKLTNKKILQHKTKVLKMIGMLLIAFLLNHGVHAQLKSYSLSAKGDTINAIDKNGQKTGKWVVKVEEIRGEPGYEEEGLYKKGEKHGYWRRYNLTGDLIGVEHYILGGKDGLQQYFNYLGDLEREESWKGYNPDAPYDTIPVYGTGSGEIVDYKIVKTEPYSVKHGDWKFYEPGSGRLIRTEKWERNNLVRPDAPKPAATTSSDKPKQAEKTAQMLEWEKKNKGKKNVVRDGATGL